MTDQQTVTVNVHHPQVQNVNWLEKNIAVTLGNDGAYHGQVTLILTPEQWCAIDFQVRKFLADDEQNTDDLKPGDRVRIIAGGPHENYYREATVRRLQPNGDVIIYFGDIEWVYSPGELVKL